MKRIWIAAVAVILVGWLALQWSDDAEPREIASASIAPPWAHVIADLPDTPEEWEGRIDYRALDQQFADIAARPEMAGLAVAIVEDGKLRFVRTYGVADRSTGAPVTTDTVFRWASVSKTVAGMLAAKLATSGKVDLDRPVASWGGSLRLPDGAEARISFAQLLSQQTGLTKNAYDERLESGEQPDVLRTSLANAPLQCQPGTCHTYQNIAFDAASEILTASAGMPYAEVASRAFFRPLGMASAGFGMAPLVEAKDWARPHNGSMVRPLKENYWRVPAAAGVDSNIVDFARWLQAVMVYVIADFCGYWTHRLFNRGKWWPFHAVHHSSEDLDWLGSLRVHPVNDLVNKLAQAAPLKRLGDDDDLKGAVLLLASAAGKHITGQILAVDGGVSSCHGG
jgi:beta-lactamase class C